MRHLLLAALAAATLTATPALATEINYTCEKGSIQGYNDLVRDDEYGTIVYVRGNMNLNLLNPHHDDNTWSGNVSGENTSVKFDVKSAIMTVTTNGKPTSYKCKKA